MVYDGGGEMHAAWAVSILTALLLASTSIRAVLKNQRKTAEA
jgi:hypothetical protein